MLASAGCVGFPELPPPGGPPEDMHPAYADRWLAHENDGVAESCTDVVVCPPAACNELAALGAPDDVGVELFSGGRVEVGFVCSFVLDRSGEEGSTDLRVWAVVDEGSRGVVSVSEDGAAYWVVGDLTTPQQEFDIARVGLSAARFVAIDVYEGRIEVDAIEAM